MYKDYFGFSDLPFSIAPDPNYLYLSEQHKEALAHLLYGVGEQGGFVLLSGEVGTGKTTICRALLHQMPEHCEVAYVVNPRQTDTELLRSICDEFGIYYFYEGQGSNYLVDLINEHLLTLHAKGQNAVLIIDEAQNLGVEVLEQLRLLTNLETDQKKLLQLILLGQPELNELLARTELRQLAQRITARHHLKALDQSEVAAYIEHRLQVAGFRGPLFTTEAVKLIYRKSQGIPRIVNVICDRCLLGVYSANGNQVNVETAKRAIHEVMGTVRTSKKMAANTSLQKFSWRNPILVSCSVALTLAIVYIGASLREWIPPLSPKGDEIAESIADTENVLSGPREDSKPLAQTPASLSSNEKSQQQLLSRLSKRFGLDANIRLDGCGSVQHDGLSCVARRSDLKSIVKLETTILAKLPNSVLPANQVQNQSASQWVLMTAMPAQSIEIEFANQQRVALPPATLADAWPVDYYWLWRAPNRYRQNLSLGETDEFVAWLAEALANFEKSYGLPDLDSNSASTGGSALLQKSSFLLSMEMHAESPVVSTELLRRLTRAKELLELDEPGVPQELAYLLVRTDSSPLKSSTGTSLAMRAAEDTRKH